MGVNGVQQFFMGVGFLTVLALIVVGAWWLVARRDTYGDRLAARYARRAQKKAARSEDKAA